MSGDPRFHALLKEIGDLHDKKQKDYGLETDPFANVRGSEEWGVRPWVGAMVRMGDKIKRLKKYSMDHILENETARDSFLDAAVYTLIALILHDEEEEGSATREDLEKLGFQVDPGYGEEVTNTAFKCCPKECVPCHDRNPYHAVECSVGCSGCAASPNRTS